MDCDRERAVAVFGENGGVVQKLPETIPVTAWEVTDYLESCGVSAKLRPNISGKRVYFACQGKLASIQKLIHVANRYRCAQKLAPFAAITD
jgi:hypothetical protein